MKRTDGCRFVHHFLAMALGLLVTWSAPQHATGQPTGGKTLTIALDQSDVKTLDPGHEFEMAAGFIVLNTYDTLVAHKNPSDLISLVPVLAREWKISPDGKEYTFKLRDDVKFTSGNPLTSDDVKFSLTRLRNLKGNPSWMMDPLKEVQVIDRTTVKMVLNEPFADWLAVLAGPNSGIMDSKTAKEHGASDSPTADKDDKAEEWLNQNSAGSGPFILRGWLTNNTITLERNPSYWGGAPRVAKVSILDVRSPATQKLQVESGDVDIALNLTPDLVEALRSNKNVRVLTGQSLDAIYMGLTTNPQINPNLAKKEVRQAIRAAIDYGGILKLTRNMAIRGPAVFPIGILGLTQADADRLNPRHDLKKAKDLLAKAGLSNGFKFPLHYGTGPAPAGGITYDSIAQKLQADLKKINIDVELVPQEFLTMLAQFRAKTLPAVISYTLPDYIGPSDYVGPMVLHTWGPRLYYDSPRAKELAREADSTVDAKRRALLYQDLFGLLVDEGPYVMLVQAKVQIVTRPNIKGYQYFPLGYARLLSVTKE